MPRRITTVFKAAFPYTVPVLAGFSFLGLSYGFLMVSKGFPALYPIFMSLSVYAGSMQFVAVPLLLAPFNPLYALLLTLTVNARHLFYGISMLDVYRDTGWRKSYLIFGMSDETFSVNYAAKPPVGVDRGDFMLCITLLNQFYWVAGTALGALAGNLIRFDTTGIDFSLTALFAVIFLEQWQGAKQHCPALIGVAASLGCLLLLGPDRFLLPAMVVIVVSFAAARGKLEVAE